MIRGPGEAASRALLWASTNPMLSEVLPRQKFMRRAVRKYVPGVTRSEAFAAAARLSEKGVGTLFTLFGENVKTEAEVEAVVTEYGLLLDESRELGLDLEASIKPTHLGLDLSEDLVVESCAALAASCGGAAVDRGGATHLRTLWLDMEGSGYLEPTLRIYRRLREDGILAGVAMQSYLHRSPDDLRGMLDLEPRVRLVKGAYSEPPSVALPKKADVDRQYLEMAHILLDHLEGGGGAFLALGTHDPAMMTPLERAEALGIGPDRFEIEMLYGISLREQRRLILRDAPLRVLISYGEAWFPWYMRRLAERPANMLFVVRSMFQ
ncbi:MAG: proline dehydrogenase family protein [Gemmatimonadetes bacterium]|nr:proline dehydrogenase family protein [Gemmatimonadota bacterium]